MTTMRRSLLFMPGDSRRKIEKGAGMDVDTIIMDLEDAIALSKKDEARASVLAALQEVDFGKSEVLVRTNQITPEWPYNRDILETIAGHPAGYVLPKIEEAGQIRHISTLLTEAENQHGLAAGSVKLLPIIETAMGIINLKEIAASDKRVDALIFGAEDLAGDIGATRTPDGYEIFYARSAVVLHAKAFGLQAIDTVFIDLTAPEEDLIAETETIARMGYTGKLAIHPRQVSPIQQVFTPDAATINAAQKLVAAFEAQQEQGTGVFEYEGKMIDMPMIRAARYTLHQAQACGLLPEDT